MLLLMSDENYAEHCIDERHMICDHCEVLTNFNNCHVCSEVYDTLTANLSAIFQTKKVTADTCRKCRL